MNDYIRRTKAPRAAARDAHHASALAPLVLVALGVFVYVVLSAAWIALVPGFGF